MRNLAIGLLLAMILAELGARQLRSAVYVQDPVYGWIISSTCVMRTEGNGVSHWREHGIRVCPLDGPPDAPAVLFLGDSFTQALQVNDDEVFTALVAGDLRVRALNCGQGGASAADYVQRAEAYRAMDPSWTVLELKHQDLGEDAWEPRKTHFAPGLRVEPGAKPMSPARLTLMNGLSLVPLLSERWRFLSRGWAREPALFNASVPVVGAPGPDYPLEAELELLLQAYGGRVTLLYLPEMPVESETEPTPTEGRLEAFCRERQVSFVNARHAFARLRAAGSFPFGFPNTQPSGHLNREGHAALAEDLARELTRLRQSGLF